MSPGAEDKVHAGNVVTSRAAWGMPCARLAVRGGPTHSVGIAEMPVLPLLVSPTKLAVPPGVVTMSPGRLGKRRKL